MTVNYRLYRKDFILLFITKMLRMFSYGMLAVIFFENLFLKHLNQMQASWIQAFAVAGDLIVSLFLINQADKIGRVNTLMIGALLKAVTGLVYAQSTNIVVLVISGIFGMISVTGGEIGPFMSIQQSALSNLIDKCTENREKIHFHTAKVFGYYNMAGHFAQACGAVFSGLFINIYTQVVAPFSYCVTDLVHIYALLGGLKFLCYCMMNPKNIDANIGIDKDIATCTKVEQKNKSKIACICLLFAVDSFASALVVQSFLTYYIYEKYNTEFFKIGYGLAACNAALGFSRILSKKLAQKIGAIGTTIYLHLPSNAFLIYIALADNFKTCIGLLIATYFFSQMSQPIRQDYISLMVSPSNRSSVNCIVFIASSVGLSLGLGFKGIFMDLNTDYLGFSMPFIIAGSLKIIYDITISSLLWNEKKAGQLYQKVSSELDETSIRKEIYRLK